MGTDSLERAPVQGHLGGVWQGPAQPGSRQAERRWRRHSYHFGWRYLACKLRPNPIVEGVARGEHADPFGAFAQHIGYGAPKWGGPSSRSSMDQGAGQGQMPLSAEYNLGALDQGPRGGFSSVFLAQTMLSF